MKNLKKENTGHVAQGNSLEGEGNAVDFSIKLVTALEDKFKAHNKENPNSKATLQQLKKVYIHGAHNFKDAGDPYGSLNLWGLARVNMYLGYKSGKKISIYSKQPTLSEISGLTFETEEKTSVSNFLDLATGWFPSEEDYKTAEEDIGKYNLDYSFSSLDDIYLEYTQVSFKWE